jgi:sialate O-acetylesterase
MGEVWQCAGQSNMDTRMSYYANLADTIAKATIPLMRYYTLRQSSAPVQNNVWEVITPSTAGQLSATGFFFGREIQKTTGVAVGLVVTAVGGTFVEQWLDPVTLAANPAIVDTFKGQMWNAWVSQVVGYGIRGTVWIQGEQNCNTTGAPPYGARFKLLINGWRAAWGQGNFPFYFGQLSNIHTLQTDPNNTSTVATVREGQRLALSLPATAMSVHIDIGSANNWHFPNKPEAGRRLSLLAKANTYGQNTLVYSGPLYQSATINGNKVKLLFDTHGSNLVAMGGGALTGFAIANATGSWVFGTATISGDTVIVTSASVATPTRVRYAWADNPVFNLYNTAGLPASPFTTESPNIPVGIVAEHGKVHVQAATMATSGSVAPYPVDPLGRQSPLAGNRAKQILFTKNKNTGIVLLRTQTVKQMVPGCR